MRAFGLAFLPVTFFSLWLTFHLGYGGEMYCVMYPLLMLGTVLFLRSLRPRKNPTKSSIPMWCFHCGYSLTGNTSGACPECGTAVGSSAGKSGSILTVIEQEFGLRNREK